MVGVSLLVDVDGRLEGARGQGTEVLSQVGGVWGRGARERSGSCTLTIIANNLCLNKCLCTYAEEYERVMNKCLCTYAEEYERVKKKSEPSWVLNPGPSDC